MYTLEFLTLAKDDIQNIAYYISKVLKNRSAALRVVKEIIEKTNNILIFPYGSSIYRTSNKLENEYRIIKVKKYLVFYIVDEVNKKIIIARILYEKMNIPNLLK